MAGNLWVWVSLSITKLVSTKVEIVYPTTFFEVHSIGLVLLGGQLQKINNLEVDRMSLNNTKLETPKNRGNETNTAWGSRPNALLFCGCPRD